MGWWCVLVHTTVQLTGYYMVSILLYYTINQCYCDVWRRRTRCCCKRCNRETILLSPRYNDAPINRRVWFILSYDVCRIPSVWESNRNLQKKILLYCNLHVLMLPSRYKFQKIESRRSSLLAFLKMIPQDSMFSLGEVWYTHIDDPNE